MSGSGLALAPLVVVMVCAQHQAQAAAQALVEFVEAADFLEALFGWIPGRP